jgi:DNA-binding MarR family transcriptional regulator
MTKVAGRVEASLGVLLLRSTRSRLYDRLVTDIDGVDPATYPVLSGLARLGPSTATRLAGEIGLDRTVASRHAARLQRGGLVLRREHPDDARAGILELTTAGRRVVATMRTRLVRELDGVIADWPPTKAEAFADGLERLVSGLSAGAQEGGGR